MPSPQPDDLDRLLREVRQALEEEDVETVLRLAKILKKRGITDGFVLAAHAYCLEEDYDRAIKELKAGTQQFPNFAPLWAMLGELLSDSGEYEEALKAFGKSARGEGADPITAAYDIALVRWRQGRYSEGWDALQPALVGDPSVVALEMKATLLVDLQRTDEAAPVLDRLLNLLQQPTEDGEREALSRLLALRAEVALAQHDANRAEELALGAIAIDHTLPRAAKVLRWARNRVSARARLYEVEVSGEFTEPMEGVAYDFVARFEIIAEREDQLLGFAAPFLQGFADHPRVTAARAGKPMPQEPMGVWDAPTGMHLHPRGS